jgi:hypothetical protein
MANLAGESSGEVLRLDFDRRLGAPMSLAWVHESPAPRNWHCQNLSKAAISASTRPSSGGYRLMIEDGQVMPQGSQRCHQPRAREATPPRARKVGRLPYRTYRSSTPRPRSALTICRIESCLRPRRLLGRRLAWLHRFSGLGTCRRVSGWSQKYPAASAHAESLNPSPT